MLDDEVFSYIIDFKDSKVNPSSKSYQSLETNNWNDDESSRQDSNQKYSLAPNVNVKRFVNEEDQFDSIKEDEHQQPHQTTSNFGPYVFESLSIEANHDLANSWLHPHDHRKSSNNIKKSTESLLDLRPNSKFLPVKGRYMMYPKEGPRITRKIVAGKTRTLCMQNPHYENTNKKSTEKLHYVKILVGSYGASSDCITGVGF